MLAGAKLMLVALLATPPPILEVDQILYENWTMAADALAACSAKTAAAGRAGTLWVDFAFPAFEWWEYRAPTWTVRRSTGLIDTDEACVRAVVTQRVLPGMLHKTLVSQGETVTEEVGLGTATGYLPPLASFLPLWRAVARVPSEPTRRARLARQLHPLGAVERDGCLTVHAEQRLQRAREDWLWAAGRQVTYVLQPDLDRLGVTQNVKEPSAFIVDGSVLLAGVRFDKRVGRRHAPPDWSLRLETYCLRPPATPERTDRVSRP
jgi:hypothetical protein